MDWRARYGQWARAGRFRKMLGKATQGRKRMELLHNVMEGRDYEWLIGSISDEDGDRIANENACQKAAGNSERLKKRRRSIK